MFNCKGAIRMISANLFRFKIDVFTYKHVTVFLKNVQLIINDHDEICFTEHVRFCRFLFYISKVFFPNNVNATFKR